MRAALALLNALLILSALPLAAQETLIVAPGGSAPAFACAGEDCARLALLPDGAGVSVVAELQGRELDGSALWYEVLLDCPCFDFERSRLQDLPDTRGPERDTWRVWHPWWAPDSQRIATVVFDSLYVWDADSGERLTKAHLEIPNPSHLSWSPDGSRIVLGGGFRLDDEDSGRLEPEPNLQLIDADGRFPALLKGQAGRVLDPAWSHDGTRIAAVGDEVRIFDARSGETLLTIAASATSVAWSPDDSRIALVEHSADGEPGALRLRDAAGGQLLASLEAADGMKFADLAWAPDGSQIAYASYRVLASDDGDDLVTDSALQLWDGLSPEPPAPFFRSSDWIADVDWSPDSRFLVVPVLGGVMVLDTGDGRVVASLAPQSIPWFGEGQDERLLLMLVDWSPDGRRIAATGMETSGGMNAIRSAAPVWDLTLIPEGQTRAFIHSSHLGDAAADER